MIRREFEVEHKCKLEECPNSFILHRTTPKKLFCSKTCSKKWTYLNTPKKRKKIPLQEQEGYISKQLRAKRDLLSNKRVLASGKVWIDVKCPNCLQIRKIVDFPRPIMPRIYCDSCRFLRESGASYAPHL
jgi:hypothetical protein